MIEKENIKVLEKGDVVDSESRRFILFRKSPKIEETVFFIKDGDDKYLVEVAMVMKVDRSKYKVVLNWLEK